MKSDSVFRLMRLVYRGRSTPGRHLRVEYVRLTSRIALRQLWFPEAN